MTYQGHQDATGAVAEDESTSRATPLAGFEYQIDVSVWLALDLVLVSRQAKEVVLEPASQEDLEAELADPEPGRLVSQVPMAGYTLIVQAKRREGDAWTPKTLKSLLDYGSAHRASASTRLANSHCRYLLITSAGLNGAAQRLSRRRPGMWPGLGTIPALIAKGLGHDISGRFAVIANQDDERLRIDIYHLLRESCRVPNVRLEDCLSQLRDAARARIARAGGGRLERQELEEIIRRHDGYLASSPELEHYVHPTNWADLRSRMAQKFAAILIGQSGTGKTLATQMLYDELRKEHPGLTRVLIRQGPSQLQYDTTPPPVLYDIEDPWGRFDFDENSRPWNGQLGRLFASARADKMIIATSRLDVAQESTALDSVKSWTLRLEAEHYGSDQRHKLYTTRIESLPERLQALACESETKVLRALATPLEIQKFFDALRTIDTEDFSDGRIVDEAIGQAHKDAIEQTVIDQIEARGDIEAAAILWALLAVGSNVTRTILRMIEDSLCDMDVETEANISSFINFFVAARNFRQDDEGTLSYYHPKVEAGILRTLGLDRHRQRVRKALYRLVDFLVSLHSPDASWNTERAARILEKASDTFEIKPSSTARVAIDGWIEARLAEGGAELEKHLEIAAKAGSSESNGAELARFLLHRSKVFPGRYRWQAPQRSAQWYLARAACPSTRPLLEEFIRKLLTRDRDEYREDLADGLAQLAPGLASVFMEAARDVVEEGYLGTAAAIAHGALQEFDGFEEIIDLAVDFITPTDEDLRARAQESLDIINCVFDEDYEYSLAENTHGHTAHEFFKAYIEVARRNKQWARLVHHRHIDWLRPHWLSALAKEARQGLLGEDDFGAAFEAGYGTELEEHLWLALSRDWKKQYSSTLEKRIRDGASTFDAEYCALACILKNDQSSWCSLLTDLNNEGKVERLVEIGRGVAKLCRDPYLIDDSYMVLAKTAVEQLAFPFNEICAAEINLKDEEPVVLSPTALQTLQNIPTAGALVRSLRLQLDAALLLPIEDDVRWALKTSDDRDTVVLAVSSAIRHGMSDELDSALDHRFSHAAALALTSIASSLDAPLPPRLLALADSRGSPVRLALVDALTARVHRSYKTTLIKLAKDQWCSVELYPQGEYPIARAAITGLIELGCLSEIEGMDLLTTATTSPDTQVLNAIFRLLSRSSTSLQRMLFKLAISSDDERSQSAAAVALLNSRDMIDQRLVDGISADQITSCHVGAASFLALLLGARGSICSILGIATELELNPQRRVFLFLVAAILNGRDPAVSKEIALKVTSDQELLQWASAFRTTTIDETRLAEFGDTQACAEVLRYMGRDSH